MCIFTSRTAIFKKIKIVIAAQFSIATYFLKWCDMPSFYPGVLQCSTLPKDDIRSLPAISVLKSANSSWYYMSLYEHNTKYCPASDSSSVTCRYIKSKIIASNKRTNCICITYPGLKVLDKYSQLKLR